MRQGPHQGAQKSTSTGTEDVISASKLAAVASTVHGRLVWQTLHRGTPVEFGRTRFFVPQLGQAVIVPSGAIGRSSLAATARIGKPARLIEVMAKTWILDTETKG